MFRKKHHKLSEISLKILFNMEIKETDTAEPYVWTWNEKTKFGRYQIKVIAYNNVGVSASEEITVLGFF